MIHSYLLSTSILHGAVSIKNMDATNTPDRKAPNHTTMVERMKEIIYKIPILSDRETDLTKTNQSMWCEQISEFIDLTDQKNMEDFGRPYITTYQRLCHLGLGHKSKTRNHGSPTGQRVERYQPTRTAKIVQEDVFTNKKGTSK